MLRSILLIIIFLIGIALGYNGVSLKDVANYIQYYVREGDKVIGKELDVLEQKRLERKRDKKKQAMIDETMRLVKKELK